MDFEVPYVMPIGEDDATSIGICGPLAVRIMLSINCLLCITFSNRGVSEHPGSQQNTCKVAESADFSGFSEKWKMINYLQHLDSGHSVPNMISL